MVEMLSSLASSTSDGYGMHESFKRFHDHSIDSSLKEVRSYSVVNTFPLVIYYKGISLEME